MNGPLEADLGTIWKRWESLSKLLTFYPPAIKVSREVANLTWSKNPQTPVYGAKEFVCLSICLSVTKFDLIYIRTGK